MAYAYACAESRPHIRWLGRGGDGRRPAAAAREEARSAHAGSAVPLWGMRVRARVPSACMGHCAQDICMCRQYTYTVYCVGHRRISACAGSTHALRAG